MSTTLTVTKEQFTNDKVVHSQRSAEVKTNGLPKLLKKVYLSIGLQAGEDEQVFDKLLTTMNTMLQNLDTYASYAADELLELFNEEWNDDGETIDKAEFAKKLKLESITVRSTDSEIFFDDGELFQGHVIVVNLDAEGKLVSADIAG